MYMVISRWRAVLCFPHQSSSFEVGELNIIQFNHFCIFHVVMWNNLKIFICLYCEDAPNHCFNDVLAYL